jgi:hypothetical protein
MAIRKYWLLIAFTAIVVLNLVNLLSTNQSSELLASKQKFTGLQPPKDVFRAPMWLKEHLTPYIADNFVGRQLAIFVKRRTKLMVGDEPNFHVLTGKKEWLFLGSPLVAVRDAYGDSYSDMLGFNSTVQSEVEAARVQKLARICKQNNARLIVIYPPNKNTMYAEFLPSKERTSLTALTSLEQSLAAIPVSVIYAKSLLEDAKHKSKDQYLYYPQDSHWNYHGASIVALNLIDKVSRLTGVDLVKPEFEIVKGGSRVSDLSRMNDSYEEEPDYKVVFGHGHQHSVTDHTGTYGKLLTCVHRDMTRVKIVVFRDSFFSALEPFLMHTNVNLVSEFGSWEFDKMTALISEEQPDVVVFERIERLIGE